MTQIAYEKSEMKTISETAKKYRENGVSDRAIRRWVKEQAFPVVRVGVKVLINQSVFEEFLRGNL